MVAFAEALAPLTLENEELGVLEGRGLVETMAESLGQQGSRCGMVPALALVYVEEDVDAPFLLDTALEHAGGAALDEPVVDAVGGGRPALHLPSFGPVHGEIHVLQKL